MKRITSALLALIVLVGALVSPAMSHNNVAYAGDNRSPIVIKIKAPDEAIFGERPFEFSVYVVNRTNVDQDLDIQIWYGGQGLDGSTMVLQRPPSNLVWDHRCDRNGCTERLTGVVPARSKFEFPVAVHSGHYEGMFEFVTVTSLDEMFEPVAKSITLVQDPKEPRGKIELANGEQWTEKKTWFPGEYHQLNVIAYSQALSQFRLQPDSLTSTCGIQGLQYNVTSRDLTTYYAFYMIVRLPEDAPSGHCVISGNVIMVQTGNLIPVKMGFIVP